MPPPRVQALGSSSFCKHPRNRGGRANLTASCAIIFHQKGVAIVCRLDPPARTFPLRDLMRRAKSYDFSCRRLSFYRYSSISIHHAASTRRCRFKSNSLSRVQRDFLAATQRLRPAQRCSVWTAARHAHMRKGIPWLVSNLPNMDAAGNAIFFGWRVSYSSALALSPCLRNQPSKLSSHSAEASGEYRCLTG